MSFVCPHRFVSQLRRLNSSESFFLHFTACRGPFARSRGRLAACAGQRGQAMVEYVIVVALVAVAAIAVYQLFGQVIRAQTAAMAREIAGEDGSEQSRMAQSAAESAATQAAAKSLKSFTGNAAAGQ